MNLSETESRAGLTEPLPPGETILWQSGPARSRMGASIFHYRWLVLYVAGAIVLAMWGARQAGYPLGETIALATLAIPLAAIGFGLLEAIGRLSAKAATYTLTNRRIIMKIGIALDMTVSIPLSAITDASIRQGRGRTGDIALIVKDTGGVGFVALWPHARPWHFTVPSPMLRALPDVEHAAMIIGDALVSFNTAAPVRQASAEPMPVQPVREALTA